MKHFDPRELPEHYQVEIKEIKRAEKLRALRAAIGIGLLAAIIGGILVACAITWFDFLSEADLGPFADRSFPANP